MPSQLFFAYRIHISYAWMANTQFKLKIILSAKNKVDLTTDLSVFFKVFWKVNVLMGNYSRVFKWSKYFMCLIEYQNTLRKFF